jgi:hypothetical protein
MSDRVQDKVEEKVDIAKDKLQKTSDRNEKALKRANAKTQKNINEGKKEFYDAEEALKNIR